jgi:hypothetical protein
MTADLEGGVNNAEQTYKDITYRSVLLPAPALAPTTDISASHSWVV